MLADILKYHFTAVTGIVDSVWEKPNTALFLLLFFKFREVCSYFGKVISADFFKVINASFFSIFHISFKVFRNGNLNCLTHTSYNIFAVNFIWRLKQIFSRNKLAVWHWNRCFITAVWNVRSKANLGLLYTFKAEFTFAKIIIARMSEFTDNIGWVVRYKFRCYLLVAKTKFKFHFAVLCASEKPLCNKHINKKLIVFYIKSSNFAHLTLLIRQTKWPHILVMKRACFGIKIYEFKQSLSILNFESLIFLKHCFMLRIVEKNIIINSVKEHFNSFKIFFLLLLIKDLKIIIVTDSPIKVISNHWLNIRNNLTVHLFAIFHKLHMVINKRIDIKRFVKNLIVNGRIAQITASVKI